MKTLFFINTVIVLFLTQSVLYANSMPDIIIDSATDHSRAWTKQYGSSDEEEGHSVTTDSSGNIYITGFSDGDLDGNTNSGYYDIFLTKFNSNGTKLWTKEYGSRNHDKGNSVTTDSSGNIYITGFTEHVIDGNTNSGGSDIFLTKFSSNGRKIWTKQYGSSSSDYGNSVITDSDGNIYITGTTYGDLDGNTNSGSTDIFLTKFSSDGTKLWTKQYGSSSSDYGNSVTTDSSGNIYITGETFGDLDGNTNSGGGDIFLTKFSSYGWKFWTKQYGSSSSDYGNSVTTDRSGNIYITGTTYGDLDGNTNRGFTDFFLTKFSSDGTKLWTKQYGSGSSDYGNSVTTDSYGNIYITGTFFSRSEQNAAEDSYNIFLFKFSSDGTRLWSKLYGTNSPDIGSSITIDSIGNIYITGETFGDLDGNSNSGYYDIFLTKYEPYREIHINHQAGSTAVIDVDAIDTDYDLLHYHIINSQDSGDFTIDNTTGELSFKLPPYTDNPLDNNADNTYEVNVVATDSYGGSDTLPLRITVGDFRSDGKPNILWHNSTNGAVKIMPLSGDDSMLSKESISVVSSSNTNLVPRGIGDFTREGNPDILFHNQNSGNLRIWKMDGTVKVDNIQILGSSNTNLKIAGVGDFDGDGDNDVATFNTNSGALRIWVMEGTVRVDNVLVLTGANTNLIARGVGDMDGDGIPDLVLRNNNSGAVRVWTMNSDFSRKGNEYVTGSSNTNLELRGVVDINGDGDNDILNYNTNTGVLRAWLMDGNLNIGANAEFLQNADLDWSVRGGGDSISSRAAPVANAGVDQNVNTAETITLDGSGSSNALTYSWNITFKPEGSSAILSSKIIVNPTFLTDHRGYYVIELTVNNGTVSSITDRIIIMAMGANMNTAPVAEAGENQIAYTGATVTLDGTSSFDADGDALATYAWLIMAKPPGSNANLDDRTIPLPEFVADVEGSYVIRLIVNDGIVNSAADTVTVTVLQRNPITFPLEPGMTGDNVADLHIALQFLLDENIFELSEREQIIIEEHLPSEVNTRYYGEVTTQLIILFQEKYDLMTQTNRGEVDEQTAQKLNSVLEELGY